MKNIFKKSFCILMSILLISAVAVTASASSQLDGNGTYSQPYLIKTAQDLVTFAQKVALGDDFDGKFVKLANDITADSSFSPIGTKDTSFGGYFDGNGKTVSGLSANGDCSGFFAFCDGAVISNLNINGSFTSSEYVGGIAAYAENSVIKNCTVSASLSGDSFVGGIVGYMSSGSIKDCSTSTSASIIAYEEYCGGIVGFSGADIYNCTNNAYIIGSSSTGGIAGYSDGDISLCVNSVNLEGTDNLGGIAGVSKGKTEYSENTGILTAEKNVGGIVGVASKAEISQCVNSGNIISTDNFTGGIVGNATESKIANCLSTANVISSGSYAGGIFGNAQKSEISKCVFWATVTTSDNTQGAIGSLSSSSVSDCYAKNLVSRLLYTGTGSNCEIVASPTFSALDFNTVWEKNTLHADYPLLKNVSYHTLSVTSSTKATCTSDGVTNGVCIICNTPVSITTPSFGHTYKTVSSKFPTCTVKGYTDKICTECGVAVTENVSALGHVDENNDKVCDVCNISLLQNVETPTEKSFFEKLADFFRNFINWLNSIFSSHN